LTESHRADQANHDKIAASVPLGRWGVPADVAAAAVFLASGESAYMTGSNIAVDGGLGQF
jgi:2-deoxy-D-gluconate 3-dehydrogenase